MKYKNGRVDQVTNLEQYEKYWSNKNFIIQWLKLPSNTTLVLLPRWQGVVIELLLLRRHVSTVYAVIIRSLHNASHKKTHFINRPENRPPGRHNKTEQGDINGTQWELQSSEISYIQAPHFRRTFLQPFCGMFTTLKMETASSHEMLMHILSHLQGSPVSWKWRQRAALEWAIEVQT
jgi:hypothetical protein